MFILDTPNDWISAFVPLTPIVISTSASESLTTTAGTETSCPDVVSTSVAGKIILRSRFVAAVYVRMVAILVGEVITTGPAPRPRIAWSSARPSRILLLGSDADSPSYSVSILDLILLIAIPCVLSYAPSGSSGGIYAC